MIYTISHLCPACRRAMVGAIERDLPNWIKEADAFAADQGDAITHCVH